MSDTLIQCRIELKYLLWDDEVDALRAALRPLPSDPRFRRDEGRIATVYVDRADGFLARQAVDSPGWNLKLRLREYFTPEGLPSSPFLWVEIKERAGTTSWKSRFQLHKRLVSRFLRGELDEGLVLTCQGAGVPAGKVLGAISRIRDFASGGELVPVGAVTYRRLAIEGGDPLARLSLDEDIAYHLGPLPLDDSNPMLPPGALGPAALEERAAVAELKYRGRSIPGWCAPGLADARASEYSKFQILSALALSEQVVS